MKRDNRRMAELRPLSELRPGFMRKERLRSTPQFGSVSGLGGAA